MGMRSRRKGQRGELECASELRRLFGIEAHRGQQFAGSSESPDVRTNLEKVHFEVKRCETLRLFAAMEQAIRDAGTERVPVVLHRPNGKPWLAIVRLDDLPQLVVQLYLSLMRKQA
jgi:hypothetical protein